METIFISTSMPGRARPDYFFALAKSFLEDGYRVLIIIDGKPESLPIQEGIIFKQWPNKRPTKPEDFVFLIKLIKTYRPSVLISSFGSVNIMNVCGYLLKVKNRINYILSVSEPFYDKVGFYPKVNRALLRKRKKVMYQLASVLVCNSLGTEQDAREYYGLTGKKFLVYHNLIRDSSLKYKGKEERKDQIVIVGNLIKRKGHHLLLNQFKNTIKLYPSLKLVIVGEGGERTSLLEKVRELKISANTEFVGNVPNRNISSYFSESLVSISASIHEAFGFVNIEAMREGTPIISTPTAGAQEILNKHENGEFFTLENENSLTEAVTRILEDWELFSYTALMNFNNSYSLDKQINNHRELLKKEFY